MRYNSKNYDVSFNAELKFDDNFQVSRTPQLYFGRGSVSSLEKIVSSPGNGTAAVFTGSSFLQKTGFRDKIYRMLTGSGRKVVFFAIPGEPDPSMVDDAVEEMKRNNVTITAAIGGGSVIDAGKAASVMALHSGSVRDYLEGVGTLHLKGPKLPFIAVPTTSGTGSEATKNSVISSVGEAGFKKSLRHESMVPDYAVIDPELMISCPPEITASSGMDAVTQLLESFVSVKASVYTDSLASAALKAAGMNIEKAVFNGSDVAGRAAMAWAAYVSGITLTAAGLGVVHGIASPAGGFSAIPHGTVCGTLLLPATKYIINRLFEISPDGNAMQKYASASELLTGREYKSVKEACDALIERLDEWTIKFSMPYLEKYGFEENLIRKTAAASDGKNSPVRLETDDIYNIMMDRLKENN